MQLPFLNEAFGTIPLGATEWFLCIALASIVLWADEARKLIGRRIGNAMPGGATPEQRTQYLRLRNRSL